LLKKAVFSGEIGVGVEKTGLRVDRAV